MLIGSSNQGVHELLNNCPKITHLSLTGIAAFFSRDDLVAFCREAPPGRSYSFILPPPFLCVQSSLLTTIPLEFNEEQRQVFCVFSGDGVNKLRDFLNSRATHHTIEESAVMFDDQDGDVEVVDMMQNTALDEEGFDDWTMVSIHGTKDEELSATEIILAAQKWQVKQDIKIPDKPIGMHTCQKDTRKHEWALNVDDNMDLGDYGVFRGEYLYNHEMRWDDINNMFSLERFVFYKVWEWRARI
jgi:hypothetical protein